jgi:glycosyltransferase involved in cell wall biosynthesis
MTDYKSIPIFINVYNRLQSLMTLLAWLETAGYHNIVLIDNGSTYPPLLHYLNEVAHRVIRLPENMGQYALWRARVREGLDVRDQPFVYTDSDIVPDPDCPVDVLARFEELLRKYAWADKVGFGLRIDDIPDYYARKADVLRWEGQYWDREHELEPRVFKAAIDTTFALYRPTASGHSLNAIRTGAPYMARHWPWYVDSQQPDAETLYYRRNLAHPELASWEQAWRNIPGGM